MKEIKVGNKYDTYMSIYDTLVFIYPDGDNGKSICLDMMSVRALVSAFGECDKGVEPVALSKKLKEKAKRKALVQEMRNLSDEDKTELFESWKRGVHRVCGSEYEILIEDWLDRKHSGVLDLDSPCDLVRNYIFKKPKNK